MKFCKHPSHEGENPLPLDLFPKEKRVRDGHGAICKFCYSKKARLWREQKALVQGNPLPRRNTGALSTYRLTKSEQRVRLILRRIKKRSKRAGIPFALQLQDLCPLPKTCPDLGIDLDYTPTKRNAPNYISLDRIVPERGYVVDNVRLISYKANTMKQNATLEELKTIATSWLRLAKRQKN